MELWSLMHFLMPHVFQSHREFKEWFSNPMTGMIEGNSEYNDKVIKRLHQVCALFIALSVMGRIRLFSFAIFRTFNLLSVNTQLAGDICKGAREKIM